MTSLAKIDAQIAALDAVEEHLRLFGEVIDILFEALRNGHTESMIAEVSGVSTATISNWANGRVRLPRMQTVVKVLWGLNARLIIQRGTRI